VGALVAVPIFVEGQLWGGMSTTTQGDPPPADAEEQLSEFAKLAAAAIANAENKAKLRTSRAGVVATANEARQRLQRDVDDGAQQRLVQTVLSLKLGLDAAGRGEETVGLMREAVCGPGSTRWSPPRRYPWTSTWARSRWNGCRATSRSPPTS
jgi:hypothetical protein